VSQEDASQLSQMFVNVERVVDVVQNMFKTSSALSLFENSNMLEVPYS
jgi:hypothetical protein